MLSPLAGRGQSWGPEKVYLLQGWSDWLPVDGEGSQENWNLELERWAWATAGGDAAMGAISLELDNLHVQRRKKSNFLIMIS